ncbi:hypothetical protein ACR3LQ_00310 [Kosakonia cowanii]|uniref:hypothetical protein n=1 Tax=Kosakonia cowanii TaxID=208223 RepID=UPI003EE7DF24
MTVDYENRVNNLKSRRKGASQIAAMDSMLESTQILVNKSRQQEIWESRSAGKKATNYALGSMQEVDPVYTRVSIETGERIENQLSRRLTARGIGTVYRLQGSVPLNIHIKGISDVDILVIDTQMLMFAQDGIKSSSYIPAGKDSLDVLHSLRSNVEECLTDAFPAAKVHTDNAKSVKITGGSLARDVDVVPAIWWDTKNYQQSGREADRGVAILNKNIPARVYNTPFLHISLIESRCNQTSGGLRKSIRLLKNIKADAENEGTKIGLSSFDIAAIMYHGNMTNLSRGRYFELAILAETQRWLDWLWHNFETAKLLDVPDGTRKIFDHDDKKRELLLLSNQVDDLLKAVAFEINSFLTDGTPVADLRVLVGTSSV